MEKERVVFCPAGIFSKKIKRRTLFKKRAHEIKLLMFVKGDWKSRKKVKDVFKTKKKKFVKIADRCYFYKFINVIFTNKKM